MKNSQQSEPTMKTKKHTRNETSMSGTSIKRNRSYWKAPPILDAKDAKTTRKPRSAK